MKCLQQPSKPWIQQGPIKFIAASKWERRAMRGVHLVHSATSPAESTKSHWLDIFPRVLWRFFLGIQFSGASWFWMHAVPRLERSVAVCCSKEKREERVEPAACGAQTAHAAAPACVQAYLHTLVGYKLCRSREKTPARAAIFLPCAWNRQDTQPRAVSVGDEKSGAEARALPQRSGRPGGDSSRKQDEGSPLQWSAATKAIWETAAPAPGIISCR